jgi:hypothetical protein
LNTQYLNFEALVTTRFTRGEPKGLKIYANPFMNHAIQFRRKAFLDPELDPNDSKIAAKGNGKGSPYRICRAVQDPARWSADFR